MEHRPYKITKKVINNITGPVIFNIKEFNDWVHQLCKYVLMQSVAQDVRNKNSEVGLLSEINLKGDCLQINSKWSERLQAYVIDTATDEYNFQVNIHNANTLMFIRNSSDNSGLALSDILNLISTESLFAVVVVNNNGGISFAYKILRDTPQYRRIYHDMQSDLASVQGKKDLLQKIKNAPNDYEIEIGYTGEERKRPLAKLEYCKVGCMNEDEFDAYLQEDSVNFVPQLCVSYCSVISTNMKDGEPFSSIYATEDEWLKDQATARRLLLRGEYVPRDIEQRLHKNYLELKDYV